MPSSRHARTKTMNMIRRKQATMRMKELDQSIRIKTGNNRYGFLEKMKGKERDN